MTRPINELFAARRTNRFRHNKKLRQPLNLDMLIGWFCSAVIIVAAWSLAFWLIRWAWNYWGGQ